jgi:hypothetical protein
MRIDVPLLETAIQSAANALMRAFAALLLLGTTG